jgi:hypothetical protein
MERRNIQEVGDDVRDQNVVWIYVAVLLEEIIEILELSK